MPALIEYIGGKPVKVDNVAGTGVVWQGCGDVKPVPDAAVPALLKHPGVWRVAEAPAVGLADAGSGDKTAAEGAAPPPVIDIGTDLAALDDATLRDAIRAQGLGVDCRKRGDALRAAITEALKAKA